MHDHDDDNPSPQKRGMPGWLIAVLVVGGLSLVCVVSSLFGAVSILVPRIQEKQAQTMCASHLRALGSLYVDDWVTRAAPPSEGGMAYIVGLARQSGSPPGILICPKDEIATASPSLQGSPATADAASLRSICSYAVRDFARYPLDGEDSYEFIAADASEHHRGGIVVLRADGGAYFMDRESLGLAPDEPIIVGPGSSHAELKKLCIVPAE